MNQLFYLHEPISIPGSELVIIALDGDGAPYGIRKGQFIGDEFTDLDSAFSLMPYFTRMAERGDEAPDIDDLMNSIAAAVIRGEALYGKGTFT